MAPEKRRIGPLMIILLLAAVNMTSTAVNVTSPAVNMTSPGVNMTSPGVNMTSPGVNMTTPSVNVTAAPNATAATTTASTDPPTSSEGSLGLTFSLNQTFTSDLSNSSSTAFKTLSAAVVQDLNRVGRGVFGSSFLRSIVNGFRSGSVVVDSTLVFKDKSSVPSASNATSQLASSLTSNSTSLNIIAGSVVANSTAAPNATVAPTAAPNATVAPTAAPNATVAPTAAPNATVAPASTDPPTSTEGTLRLLFSLSRSFTSDLSNPSSVAFKALAAEVIKEVNRVATNLYGSSFRRTLINNFTSGSVKVDNTLVFKDKSSVPDASMATSQFSTALAGSSLGIVNGSVSAQSTSTSGSPPIHTMSSLAVFSLTLLAVAPMLVDL